jgi:hypothetical protein
MITSSNAVCDLQANWAATDVYSAATLTKKITGEKAVPVITWATPNPITYPTPLGSKQLDATANVSGSFSYSPDAGTILKPTKTGKCDKITATFTPSDTNDYTTKTTSVCLVVN